jgi:hypothetical protein
MAEIERRTKRYPSDLTDAEWERSVSPRQLAKRPLLQRSEVLTPGLFLHRERIVEGLNAAARRIACDVAYVSRSGGVVLRP